MTARTTASILAVFALGAVALALGPERLLGVAGAQTSKPSSGSAAASSASPSRPPPAVSLSSLQLPSTPSEKPTLEEWKTATRVEPSRRSGPSRHCRVSVLREWMKVHCDGLMAGLRQYSGSTQGVLLWVTPFRQNDPLPPGAGGEIIMPLREGDRRLFQFFSLGGGDYEGLIPELAVIVEEVWLEGEAHPTLVLR